MSSDLQSGAALEQGKAAILEHMREMLASGGVDLKLLVLKWDDDSTYHRWVLRIFRGKHQNSLTFTERDIVAWPKYLEVAGKYEDGIRKVVVRLKSLK